MKQAPVKAGVTLGEEVKSCSSCSTDKPRSEFYVKSDAKDGLNWWCKECCRKYYNERYSKNERYRERHKERRLKVSREEQIRIKFSLNQEGYNALLSKQEGACALCDTKDFGRYLSKHFCIDHDHATGKVRGLLCHSCNIRVGAYEKLMKTTGIEKLNGYLQSTKE